MKEPGDLAALASIVTPKLRKRVTGPTALERRLLAAATQEFENPLFMHTVLCQTGLPYRDPGDEVRKWERTNGKVHLLITAGARLDPQKEFFVDLGLPFGTKARTILMHINQRALATQSPEIEMEDSLTGFVRRVLQIDPAGRNMRAVKEQLARLEAANITMGFIHAGGARTINSHIVEEFDTWFPKDEHQRALWPGIIKLAPRYFESLQAHAVPLDEAHIAALAHSAMALDVYTWLAQRLHRVKPGQPERVSWKSLHQQFGSQITLQDNFRRIFRVALGEVLAVYRAARIEEDGRRPSWLVEGGAVREAALFGITLHHSPPPAPPRIVAVCPKP